MSEHNTRVVLKYLMALALWAMLGLCILALFGAGSETAIAALAGVAGTSVGAIAGIVSQRPSS